MMKILILDPSINLLKLLSDNLGQYNYMFQGAPDVEVGCKCLRMGYQPEIIIVNTCFCIHPTISELEKFFQLLNYPYRAIIAIIDSDNETNRSHAANMGFHAVIAKPLNLKKVLTEIESIAGVSAEHFTFSPIDKYNRREIRLPIAVEVVIKIVDEISNQDFVENTVTEDISLNGAAVLSLFELKIGTAISIAPVGETEFCVAIVRRTSIGTDNIRRLNLEIIGKRWQDFCNELTQIHASQQLIPNEHLYTKTVKQTLSNQETESLETHDNESDSQEIPNDEIELLEDDEFDSQEISNDEIEPLEANDDESLNQEILSEEIEPLDPILEETVKDRYKIVRELGKGGLGIVYQATDITNGKNVALKFLTEDQTLENPSTNQQFFEREIKILSQIQHPNIVSILDSGISKNGKSFFVMDYIEGKSLDQLIRKEKIWPASRVLNILQQICPALYAMHSKNLIHRDLKPGNIMIQNVDDQEKVILLDLGIAKMVNGNKENSLMKDITKTGMIVGTLGYTSPEQCMDAEIDDGVDIYSLGVITYQLLTGEMPFVGSTMVELILAHVQSDPIEPRQINPNISKALESVILWSLAKTRSQRPKTIMEFLKHFELAAQQDKLENISESTQQTLEPLVQIDESTGPVEPFELISESLESITELSTTPTAELVTQPLEEENPITFFFSQD